MRYITFSQCGLSFRNGIYVTACIIGVSLHLQTGTGSLCRAGSHGRIRPFPVHIGVSLRMVFFFFWRDGPGYGARQPGSPIALSLFLMAERLAVRIFFLFFFFSVPGTPWATLCAENGVATATTGSRRRYET